MDDKVERSWLISDTGGKADRYNHLILYTLDTDANVEV